MDINSDTEKTKEIERALNTAFSESPETTYYVIERLVEHEQRPTELAAILHKKRSTVSDILRKLARNNISIAKRRDSLLDARMGFYILAVPKELLEKSQTYNEIKMRYGS